MVDGKQDCFLTDEAHFQDGGETVLDSQGKPEDKEAEQDDHEASESQAKSPLDAAAKKDGPKTYFRYYTVDTSRFLYRHLVKKAVFIVSQQE